MNNYGVHWDDKFSIEVGKVNYNYITGKDTNLLTYYDRDYGPIVELTTYYIYKTFGNDNYANHILIRHVTVLVIFSIGLILFYLLQIELGISLITSLFGLLFFILSPRIYGNSFYNSKDIPLMVGYVFMAFTLIRFLKKLSFKNLLLHCIASALMIDIRIVGIVSVPFTLFFIGFYVFNGNLKLNKVVLFSFLYLIITSVTIVIIWPYLWQNPMENFIMAFENMQFFRWDGTVLFVGENILASELPYIYLLWSLLITITIPQVIIGIISIITAIILLFNFKNIGSQQYFNFLFALLLFASPIAIIIYKESIVYDSWRHIYFTYPFLILISVLTVDHYLNKSQKIKLTIQLMMIASILLPMFSMIKNNPFQSVYFNPIARIEDKPLYQQYDMDYWGVYYKRALYDLIKVDNRNAIDVAFNINDAGFQNLELVNSEIGTNKFVITDKIEKAKYYITNFRYECVDLNSPKLKLIKSYRIDGEIFMNTYAVLP